MVWGVIAASAVAVSAQVVLGDSYPPRHIEFAGGVTGFPDLVYQTLPGFRPLHLGLYRPEPGSDKTLHPFVVYVHGGGWSSGHTRQAGAFTSWPDVLAALAARGYVVASVEYRLSGEAPFPAAEQDVKAAIRWLRSQASTYQIDRTRGLIWGASAGGQLAALAATSCGVAALEPVGAPAESDCVQGAVSWYGVFDFSRLPAQNNLTRRGRSIWVASPPSAMRAS
jgi:acetyl esterase/lipase